MNVGTTTGRDMSGLLNYMVSPVDAKLPPGFDLNGDSRSDDSTELWWVVEGEIESNERYPRSVSGPNLVEEVNDDLQRSPPLSGWREGRAELIASNMTGRSIRELLPEFRALASLRPDVRVNTRHFILSTPENDQVTRDTQALIAERFASLMGLDRRMWAAFRHKDHAHDEIHIVTTNSDLRGSLPSDSFIYDKAERAARQLEEEFGLSRNRSSREAMRRCPTQGKLQRFERTGELGPVISLQAKIDKLLNKKLSFTEFAKRLEQNGTGLTLFVGERHIGTIYEFDGKRYRGRRLGRGYTFTGLQREWPDQQDRKGIVEYVNERDYAAFSERASGYVARSTSTTDSRRTRPDGSDAASDRGRRLRHSGEARQAGGDRQRTTEQLAWRANHSSLPDERGKHHAPPGGTIPTKDTESGRAGQEAAGGQRGGDRRDGAPATAGNDQHLQGRTGRNGQRIQEIPSADDRGHEESKPSDRNMPLAGEPVQQDGPAMSETSQTIRGQLSKRRGDDNGRSGNRRRAGEGGGHCLDESNGRGSTEVFGELPLFDAGVPPTSMDDGSRADKWHPAGNSHQRVDFGAADQQSFAHDARDGGEGQMCLRQNDVEDYLTVSQLKEDIWTSNHDALSATRRAQTDDSDLSIEDLNDLGKFLPPESTPDLIQHVDGGRRTGMLDDKFSVCSDHEHGLTDESPSPDSGFEDKDTDDFGR